MSENGDKTPEKGSRKRLPTAMRTSESSDSDSSIESVPKPKRIRVKNYISDSVSDSDSSIEVVHKRRVMHLNSIFECEESTSSSGSDIVHRRRNTRPLSNVDDSSDCSESDWDVKSNKSNKQIEASDASSGEEREHCPICLAKFRNQAIGTPESCDHSFCLDCILEWAKKVQTCPVDRQPFGIVLHRETLNGKVMNQVVVEKEEEQFSDQEFLDDFSFCQICGCPDNEATMLLCDACNLGYHMACLDPPLHAIPDGEWMCPYCTPVNHVIRLELDQRNIRRSLARTRHMERVRSTIQTNRAQTTPGNSSNSRPIRRRKKRTRKRSRRTKIKIVYETNEVTGETVAIETKVKRRKRRKRKIPRRRNAAVPKTVKKRLAAQLGICKLQTNGQFLPDVRISNNCNDLTAFQRNEAGIPRLHIFGRTDCDLNSASGSDSEIETGSDVLMRRRRPNLSDATILRRAARRKAVLLPPQPSTSNLLDNILDMQTKFHARDSVLSLNTDGSIKIDKKMNGINNNKNKNDDGNSSRRININNYRDEYLRQCPNYGNNSGNSSSPNSSTSNSDENRRVNTETTNNIVTTSSSDSNVSDLNNYAETAENFSSTSGCFNDPKKDKKSSNKSTPNQNSDSDLDIYSDIETVSTSRVEVESTPQNNSEPTTQTDEEANSDVDLIIDTEKQDEIKDQVSSSTVDVTESQHGIENIQLPHSTTEIQNETVSTMNNKEDKYDDDDSEEEGCPNFSIYSSESINFAKNTDLGLLGENLIDNNKKDEKKDEENKNSDHNLIAQDVYHFPSYSKDASSSKKDNLGLYSDSEDEELVKMQPFSTSTIINAITNPTIINLQSNLVVDTTNQGINQESQGMNQEINQENQEINQNIPQQPFQLNDIINMTEDISEEERSYTPCLDERKQEGLDGLGTEMISDEEYRNDFDESHEVKTTSDGGDALEINAKESELDFSKPEDFEEGEIVDKLKKAEELKKKKELAEKLQEENNQQNNNENKESESSNNNQSTMITGGANFKKLSRSNKDRNYREKDKEEVNRSKSREKEDKENKKSKKKEKRKEIVRYNVRSIIAKPRRDKFGRDKSRRKSASRSSRSRTRSRSRSRSISRERKQRRRVRSRSRSERRRSRSRSRQRKRRSKSRSKKRTGVTRKSSVDHKKHVRTPSPSPTRRRRDNERRNRGWTRSRSPSFSPEMQQRLTPSWTPPRIVEQNQPQRVQPQNLTVILNNDLNNKKKKDKKKKDKRKEVEKNRKRKRDKTPPPSKEVFASGNNILVSVSFNKDTGERDVTKKRRDTTMETTKKGRKEKRKVSDERKKKKKEMAGVKPVAIIDLDRSPFRELTPPHQDVIVLTDSENNESNDILLEKEVVCDSSQQAVTPETMSRQQNYSQGPKTPPEPQVKFTLNPKQNQMRAITNPLHEPDELENDENQEEEEEELEERSNDNSQQHKGPNTPPEPPNSPPSSPDAYDPFDPTKSRTPTPIDLEVMNNGKEENTESCSDNNKDDDKSHTPIVIADIQPADSQTSTKVNSPERNSPKSDQQLNIGVIINQVIQPQTPTIPQFSSNNLITSTPMSNLITQSTSSSRINILNSTLIAAPIVSTLPRIILPTATKSSPVKVSPNKLPIKSTPIKPMVNKSQNRKSLSQSQDGDVTLDFDSPYSPGSSDYEDLFEPPTDKQSNKLQQQEKVNNKNQQQQKSPTKQQNTFDVLFGSSPINTFQKSGGKTGGKKGTSKYKRGGSGKTKQVGVKIDEDSFKILDEVPNSAVEMQVKDKFVDDWVLSVGPTSVCNKEKLQYLKKLNRQERVVEEVKLVLKPHYNKKHINKEEYKDILRRAVPKICHNKSGEINPQKIQNLIEAYVKKVRHNKKVTSSSSAVNPQKI